MRLGLSSLYQHIALLAPTTVSGDSFEIRHLPTDSAVDAIMLAADDAGPTAISFAAKGNLQGVNDMARNWCDYVFHGKSLNADRA